MQRIEGVVQHYAWGDPRFLPQLLGVEPDGRPWAEWWIGTHPNGPAHLADGRALADVAGELPYLLKVLAAAEPLSLQTHPSAEQAIDGHRRGIYPDDQAKPELLCAITPFEALCGLRPAEPTVALLQALGASELAAAVAELGPGGAVTALYRGEIDAGAVVLACADAAGSEAQLVRELAERYPGDSSVAVTLLLNHVRLEPGEAIRLAAGNLHAYLSGAGVELMGCSDNVVRGGLTVKPVDVDELLRVLDPTPLADPVLRDPGRYPLSEVGVELRRIDAGERHRATDQQVAIDLAGNAWLLDPGDELVAAATTFAVVPTTA